MYSAIATKKIVLKDRTIVAGRKAQFNKHEIEAYGFALEDVKEIKEEKPKATNKGKGKSTKTSPQKSKKEE